RDGARPGAPRARIIGPVEGNPEASIQAPFDLELILREPRPDATEPDAVPHEAQREEPTRHAAELRRAPPRGSPQPDPRLRQRLRSQRERVARQRLTLSVRQEHAVELPPTEAPQGVGETARKGGEAAHTLAQGAQQPYGRLATRRPDPEPPPPSPRGAAQHPPPPFGPFDDREGPRRARTPRPQLARRAVARLVLETRHANPHTQAAACALKQRQLASEGRGPGAEPRLVACVELCEVH